MIKKLVYLLGILAAGPALAQQTCRVSEFCGRGLLCEEPRAEMLMQVVETAGGLDVTVEDRTIALALIAEKDGTKSFAGDDGDGGAAMLTLAPNGGFRLSSHELARWRDSMTFVGRCGDG